MRLADDSQAEPVRLVLVNEQIALSRVLRKDRKLAISCPLIHSLGAANSNFVLEYSPATKFYMFQEMQVPTAFASK